MATLPKIVANNSVIQMPQSRVTAADIADPFDQVARALGGAAQQLRAKELDDAQSDGENAVFRTPDGQLQVKFRGNTSEVGRTYDRVAKQSYLARLSSDIRLSGSKLAVEAKGDPTAFRASWKGFRDHLISSAPRDVRGPVQTILDSEGGKFEFGVSEQKRQFDVTTGRENLKAEAAALDDEATALALKGGSGTPEYLERMTRIRSILTEMTGNPEYGVGEKEAQISLKRMESKHIGFGLLGQVGRTFETGGLVAARKLADSVMTDESLTLSPAERRQFSREMNERIGDMMAVRQADLEPVKKQASQITERLKLGMGLDDNDIDETARKLAAGGDAAGAVKLINERAFARFAGMSDPDQLKVLEQAKAGNPTISKVPPVAVDAAREFLRGRTDKNASHIDGMDGGFSVKVSQLLRAAPPEIREGLGIYSGYRSPERQAELWQGALKKYGSVAEARKWVAPPEGVEGSKGSQHTHGKAADLGYNGQSLKNAPPNVVKWLHDNAGQFGLKFPLGNENWHIEDDGTRGGQSSGTDYSGLDLELVKEWQTEVTTDTADLFGEIKAGVLRSERPSNEDLGVLYRQMAVINDNDLKEEITRFLGAERFAATQDLLPPEQSASLISTLQADAGQGATIAQQEMLSALTRHQEAKTKALAEDSIGYGAARGLFEQPSPLDLSNPAKLTAAFSERQKAVDILNARGLTRGGSAVSVGDGAQVAQIWGTGDAKSIRTLTDAMAQGLTPKTLASTLSSGKVMSAVKGAAMSLDPAKHVEAMRALDLVEGSMGLFEVERSFGKDAVDRLQDWQSRVSYFSEKETAEWLKDRNDPSWSKRMKPVIEKGHKEARAFTFDQIASGLGVGFFGADAPTDDLTKRKLVEDFETIFADRFAVSQDAGSAKEQTLKRMQRYWGESQANNGRLMYLAPESHLPEINGGHDWIADDLKAVAGAQGFDVQGAALIADRKTESAVQAREGPGYLISVTDPDTGESDLLQDKQGRPLRWVPDPSAAQTKSLQSFEDDRQQYRPVSREDALDQWLKPLFTIGPVQ